MKRFHFPASLDGALGYLLPIPEKTYRRLLMLQNVLNSYCQHVGGLNPKAFRIMQTDVRTLSNPQKNIVDGDLINVFMVSPSKPWKINASLVALAIM